jgi:hypothetical protein
MQIRPGCHPPPQRHSPSLRQPSQRPRWQKAASPSSRRKRQKKRHGQPLDARAPLESSQIPSGATLHPDHSVFAPGSDRRLALAGKRPRGPSRKQSELQAAFRAALARFHLITSPAGKQRERQGEAVRRLLPSASAHHEIEFGSGVTSCGFIAGPHPMLQQGQHWWAALVIRHAPPPAPPAGSN